MSPCPVGESDEQQVLDQQYRECLRVVRELIPGLEDPTDIHLTAQWIERFNRTQPDEKALRNRCAKLLLEHLREDNLTHPFIFRRFLDEPLDTLLPNNSEPVGDGALEPLQTLAEQVETLNRRTAEDIRLLRGGPAESKPTQAAGDGSFYFTHLQNALRSALLLRVPDIIEHPEAAVPAPPDTLHADDREWLTVILEGIRAKALDRRPFAKPLPVCCSVGSQTVEEPAPAKANGNSSHRHLPPLVVDRDEIESYLERKFAKLYASFRVREKALEIRTQTAGGIHLIDVSQRLVEQYRRAVLPGPTRRSLGPELRQSAATLDRHRRRSDNN